jgi:hypothetical protein
MDIWCDNFITKVHLKKKVIIRITSLISLMVEQDTSNIRIQVQVLDKNSIPTYEKKSFFLRLLLKFLAIIIN